ncbi:Imm7 family immunity protein [Streptomyces sp. VRA16 Mangrove soil]|uniref:Imm7 family immunity protein n=1 Tax=Streptomyces sp. VRA16 Mangrove soil TaxID=2817434 RepID=UPI001A9CF6D9|nr:Imm7 family immunity protein [Streptomyces sp. VRA16 Mangrove soil]MBO1334152.1 hypothetical protein [Streptomyces sp. VRA16 Mangrove soil]
MFEYHGWITLRQSPEADADETGLPRVVDELRSRVDGLGSPYLADLRWLNGEAFLHVGGHTNHRPPAGSEADVVALYEQVAAVAPGAYGLLHLRDDEDPEHANELRVLRLARGTLTRHTEPLLSPCVPVVEDA